jgi:hypothetical protein
MTRMMVIAIAATMIITRDDVMDAAYRERGSRAEFASVVKIVPDSGGIASGVLIAPRWVLTAAHVANARPADRFSIEVGGERIRVLRSVLHPDYAGKAGFERAPFDQALVELERNAQIRPTAMADVIPDAGTLVTLVGYGVGGPRATDPAGTRRGAENRVDQAGGRLMRRDWPSHLLFLDFDMPGRETQNALGSATPEPLEGIASGGDSGGGLFIQRNGEWVVAATFSFSSVNVAGAAAGNFAGTINMYVGVAAHREWIRRTVGGN